MSSLDLLSDEAKNLYLISIDIPRKGDPHHRKRDRPWSVKGGSMETTYARWWLGGGEDPIPVGISVVIGTANISCGMPGGSNPTVVEHRYCIR